MTQNQAVKQKIEYRGKKIGDSIMVAGTGQDHTALHSHSALHSQSALLTDRALIRLTGAEARQFLQGLITQDLSRLSVAGLLYGALLTPQGKLVVDFFILTLPGDDTGSLMLDCPQSAAAALVQKLSLYKLRADVDITDISTSYDIVAQWHLIIGRDAGAAEQAAIPERTDHGPGFPDPRSPALGMRYYLKKDAPLADLATTPLDAYHSHLARAAIPQFGLDMAGGDVFPLDINMDALNAIDFTKGCFIGQEVASRMYRKGAIRKRLYYAEFDGDAPPPNTDIRTADDQGALIGTVRSSNNASALILVRTDKIAAHTAFIATTGENIKILRSPSYLEVIPKE